MVDVIGIPAWTFPTPFILLSLFQGFVPFAIKYSTLSTSYFPSAGKDDDDDDDDAGYTFP